MKLAILFNRPVAGDPSSEDVLDQVELVEEAAQGLGHACERVEIAGDLQAEMAALWRCAPDVVFNLAESVNDDPRLYPNVAAMLELMGLPFTGCGSVAMMATTDKRLAKLALAGAGLPTPAWSVYDGHDDFSCASVPPAWIVKPNLEDASIGIDAGSVFHDQARLVAALPRLRDEHHGQALLVEHFIDGREFNLSVLETGDGLTVLPLAEIDFSAFEAKEPRIVGFRAKWDESAFEYHNTPRVFHRDEPGSLAGRLRELAVEACRLFRVRGYARVDFRVDEAGTPFILEVNANPCLSADAGFVAAAVEVGMEPRDVVEQILACAMRRA